jgi:hypothetical protein
VEMAVPIGNQFHAGEYSITDKCLENFVFARLGT